MQQLLFTGRKSRGERAGARAEEVTFEQRPRKVKDYTGTGERSILDGHLVGRAE